MCVNLRAQDKVNLVVFSEEAEPFYVFVNGVKQNSKPEPNVKITDLTPNISLRIVFENKALPELKQNMALEPGFEHTARIKHDNKQQMKLRYFGQTPLAESKQGGVPTVAYHTSDESASGNSQSMGGTTSISSTTTTTTTKTTGTPANENVSVNINVSGVGMNMNVSGMEHSGATMNSTTSTTVTSSGYSDHTATRAETQQASAPASGSGCSGAMSPASFSNMKKSVESKPFSDTKMSTAKVATKNNCLSVDQVKQICKLFSMDEDKLTYAKYAYDYCVEKGNYYQVSEVFAFSSTTDELNAFLEK